MGWSSKHTEVLDPGNQKVNILPVRSGRHRSPTMFQRGDFKEFVAATPSIGQLLPIYTRLKAILRSTIDHWPLTKNTSSTSLCHWLSQFRAFNFGEFINGKPQQALPPLLSAHESVLREFSQRCHALMLKILRLFAIGLKVRTRWRSRTAPRI